MSLCGWAETNYPTESVIVVRMNNVCNLSSSDVSEHAEVRCHTLFSRRIARVQIASIMAGATPSSLSPCEREASPEPKCLICSCTHDRLLVWAEGDVKNTILMA